MEPDKSEFRSFSFSVIICAALGHFTFPNFSCLICKLEAIPISLDCSVKHIKYPALGLTQRCAQ